MVPPVLQILEGEEPEPNFCKLGGFLLTFLFPPVHAFHGRTRSHSRFSGLLILGGVHRSFPLFFPFEIIHFS